MSDELDLEPFGRIVKRLGEAVAALAADPSNELFRDSVIRRFELTFGLSRNTLRKFLLKDSVHLRAGVDESYAAMIRTANQDGLLLGDLRRWPTIASCGTGPLILTTKRKQSAL